MQIPCIWLMQAHKSGLPQKCHSLGQVGCRLPSLSPGGDPRKHQQVTVLCCLAPGEEQEPHGDPVHCRLYWLAAIVAQGRIRSKLSHEKQPWIYKPNGKKYGLTLPGFAALSTGHGVNAHPSLQPRHRQHCWSSPAEPPSEMQTYLLIPAGS